MQVYRSRIRERGNDTENYTVRRRWILKSTEKEKKNTESTEQNSLKN